MSLVDRALNAVEFHARGSGYCWKYERNLREWMGARGRRPGEKSIGRVLRAEQKRPGSQLRGKIVQAGQKLPNGWRAERRAKVYWWESRVKIRAQKRAAKRAERKAQERARQEAHDQQKRAAAAAAREERQRARAPELLRRPEDPETLGDIAGRVVTENARRVVRLVVDNTATRPFVARSTAPVSERPLTPEDHARMRELLEAGDYAALNAFLLERDKPPPP